MKKAHSKCCSPIYRKESSNPAVSLSSESKQSESVMNDEEEEKMKEQAQKKMKVERSLRKSIALMRNMRNDGVTNIDSQVDLQSMHSSFMIASQSPQKKNMLNIAQLSLKLGGSFNTKLMSPNLAHRRMISPQRHETVQNISNMM